MYFRLRPRFGTETLSWFCILGVFPFKFEDINYAVASREDKETMFLEYSELLNSLDSGATTKITINNRRWNKADFEQTILIPMADDDLDSLAVVYGPMMIAEYLPYGMQKALDLIPMVGSSTDIFRTNTFRIWGKLIWSPYLLITIPVLIGILCMPFAIKSWSRRMKA